MKLRNIPAVLVAATSLYSCTALWRLGEKTVEAASHDRGRILLLADSTQIEGRMDLPAPDRAQVSVKPRKGKALRLPADSIETLHIWRKNHPENTYSLVWRSYIDPADSVGGVEPYGPCWMCCRAAGRHLAICTRCDTWEFGSSGMLHFQAKREGRIVYIAFKPEYATGMVIGNAKDGRVALARNLLRFCSDDPDFCRRLAGGEIDPVDFQQVVDAYDPCAAMRFDDYNI